LPATDRLTAQILVPRSVLIARSRPEFLSSLPPISTPATGAGGIGAINAGAESRCGIRYGLLKNVGGTDLHTAVFQSRLHTSVFQSHLDSAVALGHR